jgi:hypothetical protein
MSFSSTNVKKTDPLSNLGVTLTSTTLRNGCTLLAAAFGFRLAEESPN